MKAKGLLMILLLTPQSWSLVLRHHSLVPEKPQLNHQFDSIIDGIIKNKFHPSTSSNDTNELSQLEDGSPQERSLLELESPQTASSPHHRMVKKHRSVLGKS